jgi:hypothetical protein
MTRKGKTTGQFKQISRRQLRARVRQFMDRGWYDEASGCIDHHKGFGIYTFPCYDHIKFKIINKKSPFTRGGYDHLLSLIRGNPAAQWRILRKYGFTRNLVESSQHFKNVTKPQKHTGPYIISSFTDFMTPLRAEYYHAPTNQNIPVSDYKHISRRNVYLKIGDQLFILRDKRDEERHK